MGPGALAGGLGWEQVILCREGRRHRYRRRWEVTPCRWMRKFSSACFCFLSKQKMRSSAESEEVDARREAM